MGTGKQKTHGGPRDKKVLSGDPVVPQRNNSRWRLQELLCSSSSV